MIENEAKIKGEHKASVEKARDMILNGIGTSEIMKVTNLAPEEIRKVKKTIEERED